MIVDDGLTHTLLVRGFTPEAPDDPYWFTVGGGIDPGEDERQAGVREALEEVGLELRTDELAGPFAREHISFVFGGRHIDQEQAFYVAVVPRSDVEFIGLDGVERDTTIDVQWLPIGGLAALPEPVKPAHLVEIIGEWRATLQP